MIFLLVDYSCLLIVVVKKLEYLQDSIYLCKRQPPLIASKIFYGCLSTPDMANLENHAKRKRTSWHYMPAIEKPKPQLLKAIHSLIMERALHLIRGHINKPLAGCDYLICRDGAGLSGVVSAHGVNFSSEASPANTARRPLV